MSETAARRVAGAVFASPGLIALSMADAAGWYFPPLATASLAAIVVVWGIVACLRG